MYLVNYFLQMAVIIRLFVVLTTALDWHHLSVEITNSLKLSEDVELNSGPCEIIRSGQGSFDQGNIVLFGETAGRQCVRKANDYNLLVICPWYLLDGCPLI